MSSVWLTEVLACEGRVQLIGCRPKFLSRTNSQSYQRWLRKWIALGTWVLSVAAQLEGLWPLMGCSGRNPCVDWCPIGWHKKHFYTSPDNYVKFGFLQLPSPWIDRVQGKRERLWNQVSWKFLQSHGSRLTEDQGWEPGTQVPGTQVAAGGRAVREPCVFSEGWD